MSQDLTDIQRTFVRLVRATADCDALAFVVETSDDGCEVRRLRADGAPGARWRYGDAWSGRDLMASAYVLSDGPDDGYRPDRPHEAFLRSRRVLPPGVREVEMSWQPLPDGHRRMTVIVWRD